MIYDIMNLEPNKITINLTSYNFLLYSMPGMGKTTFARDMFPKKSLLLGFEMGGKGIPGLISVPVPSYYSLLQYVDQLDTDEAREKFDTLIVDTTTKVGEIIEEYILSMFGKDSLGEAKAHGAAYPLINRYYNLAFNRLKARGYNFVYICHAKTEDIKNSQGEVIGQKFVPKMSDRINGLIEPEVDYVFFLTKNNQNQRILVTDATPKNSGKQRTNLPIILPLEAEKFKEEFEKGVKEKAGEFITDKKIETTVIQYKPKEKDYKELVAEIKDLGKKLVDEGKGNEAFTIVNNRLGQDSNGVQRTLDEMTQENSQMLETILFDLKSLSEE